MKFLLLIIFLAFAFVLKADPITVIDLHDQELIEEDKKIDDIQNQDKKKDGIEENSESTETKDQDQKQIDESSNTNESESATNTIITLPGVWQNSQKDNLEFLFQNLKQNNSKALTNLLVENLSVNDVAPESFSQANFDYIKTNTLLKIGKRKEAIDFVKKIDNYDENKDFYNILELNYLFSINDLSNACNYAESFQENLKTKSNYILKVKIFCSFIQNKTEEADFLNSILIDSNENDEYFQKIFFNLKNESNEFIDFTKISFNEDSFALYSAMLRIGDMPLNIKFLEYDPANLSLPIILSSSSEILLRLKSAHISYELGLLDSESVSALYKSVDFNNAQLENSEESLGNFNTKVELGMALLYQKANIQLLPITRLESLREFWNFSKKYNLEYLAYDISRNLINSINPSEELSEYSLQISRAHIYNKNFELAEKWILFAEKYLDLDNLDNKQEIESLKLLYDLKNSKDEEIFVENLVNNLLPIYQNENSNFHEELSTILSSVIEEDHTNSVLKEQKKLIDERIMPSRYLIQRITKSSTNNNIGELILSINVSMNNKSWKDVHPQHLQIILDSLRKTELKTIFQEIVLEILHDTKII